MSFLPPITLGSHVALPAAFLAASLVIAITPGPGVLYVVTSSIAQGRAAGLSSVGGVAVGNLGNAIAASLGLAALFAMSAFAFTLTKYVGALYLVYLGIQTIRASSPTGSENERVLPAVSLRRIVFDGFMVALFNPKTAIFFAAFLPQFLDSPRATFGATLTLSVAFVLIAATTDSIYVLTASTARRWLSGRRDVGRAGRFVSGGAFIALGLYTGLTGRRTKI